MSQLPLMCTPEQHQAWLREMDARARNPEDEFHTADMLDCWNVFALAHELYSKYPEARHALVREAPAIVERAGTELGTFMGAATLATAVGLDPEEAQKTMLAMMTSGG